MKGDKSNQFIDILGYKIFSSTKDKCLEKAFNYDKVHIVSGNPEVLFTALNNKELLYNFKSERALIIPDGVGIQISGKILKTEVKEKIAGIELMKDIIKKCVEEGKGIYLLGASQENLNACVANLLTMYPKLNLLGYKNGFFDINNPKDILDDIKKAKPEVLFVAMGCPRQENFIVKYMDELPVRIFMGVGGSFDVIGEKVKRAPRWMINIGMEWAYRVIKEPKRIKRLGSIPKFLLLVLKNRHNKIDI
jgi:N-acetylglucosaminyldiphosphoundecaprenol N-acetyl-beta-D-mannosaminyltransferase